MPVPMGAQGQADFSRPIELMMDCHRRIEHFLGVLRRVVDRYGDAELDEEGRRALETALDYFTEAAPRHTADEEESLFPRMRRCDDPAVRAAMAELDRLESDHRTAEAAHQRVDELGRRWLTDGELERPARRELAALLDELLGIYTDHIRLEDERIFELAGRTLDEASLRRVGEEMKQRRAENPGRPGSRCAERRQAGSLPDGEDEPAGR